MDPDVSNRFTQRHVIQVCVRQQCTLGARTDAAARSVEDPPQRHRVVGVDHGLQIGDRILDFLAFVEARATHQPVGDSLLDQEFFQGT